MVDDDVWNVVQNLLDATHERFVREEDGTGPNALNGAHRAKYLLVRLITCGCCGAGYTVVGEDRYGCYGRKTRGASTCGNGRTIFRFRLEERVLRRVRQGLFTPELAEAFATEVRRLFALHEAGRRAQTSDLAPALAEVERRIESLLDQIEDEPRPALLDRLVKREAKCDDLRARIAAQAAEAPRPVVLPEDLLATFSAQVRRLDTLLAGPGHIVEANELLRRLISTVAVKPDPEAPDGLAIELRGDLSWIPIGGGSKLQPCPLQGSLRGAFSFGGAKMQLATAPPEQPP